MTSHYYDEKQNSPLQEEEIFVHLFGKKYSFLSASGLFSREHLDIATKLLIEKSDLAGAKKILDLGSGWGAVIVLIASRLNIEGKKSDDYQLYASDINERAVRYTKKNALRNNIFVEVRKSDILTSWDDEKFDVILTNPPYAAGRNICYSFIEQSFEHLNKNGSLQLVARHQKGGKMLAKKMEDVFGNVESVAISSGFRIYKSKK